MTPMRWTTRAVCLALAAGLAACGEPSDTDDMTPVTLTAPVTDPPPPGHDGGDDADDDDDGGSTAASPDDTMDDDGSPPATTGAGDDAGADTGAGMGGDEDTGAGDDATTGMAGGICDPVPGDDPCNACTKLSCCPQLMACLADEACSCFMECADAGGDPFGCSSDCGADLFGAGATGDLVSCSSGPCGGSCV
jgi:hypothetical protein